ncbi:MAG: hypothetical protein HY369_02295 [Candidatus Aenigmarchaeota archaeon]|nr:hypothetical protein [Candidatus Aenigmarchaeota archaeon]
MEKKGKQPVGCVKCGTPMKSVFSDMERTYAIYACISCSNQTKMMLK